MTKFAAQARRWTRGTARRSSSATARSRSTNDGRLKQGNTAINAGSDVLLHQEGSRRPLRIGRGRRRGRLAARAVGRQQVYTLVEGLDRDLADTRAASTRWWSTSTRARRRRDGGRRAATWASWCARWTWVNAFGGWRPSRQARRPARGARHPARPPLSRGPTRVYRSKLPLLAKRITVRARGLHGRAAPASRRDGEGDGERRWSSVFVIVSLRTVRARRARRGQRRRQGVVEAGAKCILSALIAVGTGRPRGGRRR